ncbi:hypothetical protein CGQ24_08335 [Arthrobacter sp. 7749]|nr:hypothetical protein CGQ24_08335 [Arthrobacter sp. 7749]
MNSSTRSLRDIAQLASDRLGGVRGRALDREAKKLGLTLSYTTVDKILAGTYTSRPTRPTLDALAQLSEVEPSEVYAAAGVALPMKPLADQLPPDVDTLTSEQRRIVIDLARVFVKQNQHERELQLRLGSGSNEDQDKPETNPPIKRTLRAVGPSSEVVQGQKIPDRDDPAFLIPPPIEQLAAHPYFKTEHEKFEEQYGERGEENQDSTLDD